MTEHVSRIKKRIEMNLGTLVSLYGITTRYEVEKEIGATLYLINEKHHTVKRISPMRLKIREMDLFVEGMLEGIETYRRIKSITDENESVIPMFMEGTEKDEHK